MDHRLAISLSALALAATTWCFSQTPQFLRECAHLSNEVSAESRFDFGAFANDVNLTEEETVAHKGWVRNYGRKERAEYVQTFSLTEISKEFPVRSGMTIAEMDAAIAENERSFAASEFEQMENMYNLCDERRSINKGSGWISFWVNFKHIFFCDIVIESGTVQSVWVMPGNRTWLTGIYYRISGNGPHKGPDALW